MPKKLNEFNRDYELKVVVTIDEDWLAIAESPEFSHPIQLDGFVPELYGVNTESDRKKFNQSKRAVWAKVSWCEGSFRPIKDESILLIKPTKTISLRWLENK